MGLATGQEVPYLLQIQGWVLSNPETKNQNKTKSKQLQYHHKEYPNITFSCYFLNVHVNNTFWPNFEYMSHEL